MEVYFFLSAPSYKKYENVVLDCGIHLYCTFKSKARVRLLARPPWVRCTVTNYKGWSKKKPPRALGLQQMVDQKKAQNSRYRKKTN